MKIIINSKENCAKIAAREYAALLTGKPNAVLGLATGSTPEDLYKELIALYHAGEISFKQVKSYNLDEYVGLTGEHPQSYRYFMDDKLFNHVDINKDNTHVPCGIDMTNEKAAQYDKEIEAAGGIDLQLLGVGNNGHIAFNEPGTPFGLGIHIAPITESTKNAKAELFGGFDKVPDAGVSMGVSDVMQAREILFVAKGSHKAAIVDKAINGPVTEAVPASVLQLHPNVVALLDEDAAALL